MIKGILALIAIVLILATLAHFGKLGIFIDFFRSLINAILDWIKDQGGDLLKSLGDAIWRLIPWG